MGSTPRHHYLLSLGSNQRLANVGGPKQILDQAIAALEMDDLDVFCVSSLISSRALGAAARRYANAAAVVTTRMEPPEMLLRLQSIEQHFGRIRRGQRWRARTLDLDILLWSGGMWLSDRPDLAIPHRALRERPFALGPAGEIAPDWRDPLTGLSLRQLFHRLNRPKPLDRR